MESKANSCPIDCRSINSSFPTASGCSLRNVLNIALQAATSSQPELAEEEASLPFPKGDESVDEFKERSVLGPKNYLLQLSHQPQVEIAYIVQDRVEDSEREPSVPNTEERVAIRLKGEITT